MDENNAIGVYLAKNVIQLHGAAADGSVMSRKKLPHPQRAQFMADHLPCGVVTEAYLGRPAAAGEGSEDGAQRDIGQLLVTGSCRRSAGRRQISNEDLTGFGMLIEWGIPSPGCDARQEWGLIHIHPSDAQKPAGPSWAILTQG